MILWVYSWMIPASRDPQILSEPVSQTGWCFPRLLSCGVGGGGQPICRCHKWQVSAPPPLHFKPLAFCALVVGNLDHWNVACSLAAFWRSLKWVQDEATLPLLLQGLKEEEKCWHLRCSERSLKRVEKKGNASFPSPLELEKSGMLSPLLHWLWCIWKEAGRLATFHILPAWGEGRFLTSCWFWKNLRHFQSST